MKNDQVSRLRVIVQGTIQGVGFRPFIYKLATRFALHGYVKNSPQGVLIEVEGHHKVLENFLLGIEPEKPPRASIQSLESIFLDPVGYADFSILPSEEGGEKTVPAMPDIATCPDCLQEMQDPANRRFRYAFTNCTNCGPRFSIMESLPYDRPNTSMKQFTMCALCRSEYENPLDRRFHAQPNACPECGPHLELLDRSGSLLASHDEALRVTAEHLRKGAIVALKGLGGFQILTDAGNNASILRLRQRKHREEKPFALMFPSLESVRLFCEVSPLEERLLQSPESPIVILKRKHTEHLVSDMVAPGNPWLGAMLPYTPLHHLLMADLQFPVVATSGNLSEETLCTDENEALVRLHGIADVFLIHNRPITRHMDDSIARIVMGREMILRRARGYAPLPVYLPLQLPPLLAVGGHMKNTIAVSAGNKIFISQHVGDLGTTQSFQTFTKTIDGFVKLYDQPSASQVAILCDAHPDYASSRYANNQKSAYPVQHHYAHILSCMADNGLFENGKPASALGVAWDGAGYGSDSTLWGGEFLRIMDSGFQRVAHLRPFQLPGGETAIKEPRRSALGLLYEAFGDEAFAMSDLAPIKSFSQKELDILRSSLKKNINSPVTSSIGRLFDAVAGILGLNLQSGFEGQAAMKLEFALLDFPSDQLYNFKLNDSNGLVIIDWEPLLKDLLEDLRALVPAGTISAKFHNTLSAVIVSVAKRINIKKVVLSGGCFQNKYLTEQTVRLLANSAGQFQPYWHQRIPPNDGGISLGQAVSALLMQTNRD